MSDKKNSAILFDETIINDALTCYKLIKEQDKHTDVYILLTHVLQSQNEKIKKHVVKFGNSTNDNTIVIMENCKITIVQYQDIKQAYEYLKNMYCNVSIVTSSLNCQINCKINNVNCELYKVNINNIASILNGDNIKSAIINQFVYDESELLKRNLDSSNENWVNVCTKPIYGINPINRNQEAYLDLLLDDSVKLVMCIGNAGTGKTFLACLAGIHKLYDEFKYEDILITRATVNIGDNSIGYLPGSKDEKMAPWVQPIKDNLKTVLSKKNIGNSYASQNNLSDYYDQNDYQNVYLSRKKKKKRGMFIKRSSKNKLNNEDSKIKIECISFFRGRTLKNSFCIIDECQNLTCHEIKTIITRMGHNSKLVMIGDDSQSDLKNKSNSFVNSIFNMCNNKQVGVIKLNDTVRSGIAQLAVRNL